ncbi:MAG: heparinase II/III family protein [Clostridia bacterium]|nr:heparinase II/III family protein [Clostridia bacterium]
MIIVIMSIAIRAIFINNKKNVVEYNTKNIILIASDEQFKQVYNQVFIGKNDKMVKDYKAIEKRANEILEEPLCIHEIDEGNRMLDVSRKCKETSEILGFMIKVLSFDKNNQYKEIDRYSKRLKEELINVSQFEDWHPDHFLDVAEMTYGVALGYNWIYDYLSEEERNIIENGILQNGILPSVDIKYERSFANSRSNWNPICNGGVAVGAIAIMNKDININLDKINNYDITKKFKEDLGENIKEISSKELCQVVINRAAEKIPIVMEEMQDGAYEEGIWYWEYGNSYLTNFLATAQLSLNNTFGLLENDCMKQTILFPIYMTGKSSNILPESTTFNFGDADEIIVNTSPSVWLANQYYNDKELARIVNWYQDNYYVNKNIYAMLWCKQEYKAENISNEELQNLLQNINDKMYSGTEVAILEKDKSDKQGIYVAMKAGQNSNTFHSDLDIGTFILDASGTRWLEEQGREDYNVKGYWKRTGERYNYYKKRAESHSTFILATKFEKYELNNTEYIARADQNLNANCKIIDFKSDNDKSFAEMDLTSAYFENESEAKILRKITLDKIENKVILEDNINTKDKCNIISMFNVSEDTKIEVDETGKIAILSREVKQEDGSILEKQLEAIIQSEEYTWNIIANKPLNSELTNVDMYPDFQGNLDYEENSKLSINMNDENSINLKIEFKPK